MVCLTLQYTLPIPPITSTQPPNPPTSTQPSYTNNSPPPSRPALNLPTSDNDWKNADAYFKSLLIPAVLNGKSAEEKYTILSNGIYEFFASNYGVTHNIQKRKTTTHSQHQRPLKKFCSLKNQVRKDFRNAKKNNFPLEQVRELSRQYHQLVRQHITEKKAEFS